MDSLLDSIERRALDALKRLVAGKPTHPTIKARMMAGHKIIFVRTVAVEAGISRNNFRPGLERHAHVYEAIQRASKEETQTVNGAALEQARSEIARLREQLHKSDLQNASLKFELNRLRSSPVHSDSDNVTAFRQNRRTRPR